MSTSTYNHFIRLRLLPILNMTIKPYINCKRFFLFFGIMRREMRIKSHIISTLYVNNTHQNMHAYIVHMRMYCCSFVEKFIWSYSHTAPFSTLFFETKTFMSAAISHMWPLDRGLNRILGTFVCNTLSKTIIIILVSSILSTTLVYAY